MPNRLANSTSPYLQQHADNPVDWWEWGPEAFEEARRRQLPVFVSIGYSACHWCHVMAHESFEDPATAGFLNDHFVNVKVDREERPDVDSVYMDATTSLTGHGGWPMSVFVDHEGRPFYAGTYFPPEPRHGMPSFRQVLTAVEDAWATRRADVEGAAERITRALATRERSISGDGQPPSPELLADAVQAAGRDYDTAHGGFGSSPKFPPSMLLEFLLRHVARTGSLDALVMAQGTAEAMARGGIYDQLGGGFARYSVDEAWVVPHFEKMLYDNALLLRDYLHLWRLTGSALASRVVHETADFLLRDMRTAEGGFAAALDADSEGVEGKFYVWTPQELIEILGEADGRWAADLLVVTPEGTFEHGTSTLQMPRDPDDVPRWDRVRGELHAARSQRIPPGRDDKVVAAWNGLAIAALAEAGALMARPDWIDAAREAAELLVDVHLGRVGDLTAIARTSRDGVVGGSAGVLEDYADVTEGLLALYSVTGEERWLILAGSLLDSVLLRFSDDDGGFYDTAVDAERLVMRPRDPSDSAAPSGWLAAAQALLTHAAITGRADHREAAETALGVVSAYALRSPRAVGWGLAAAEALVDGPREAAVVGPADDPRTRSLHLLSLMSTAPGAVVAAGPPGSTVPLLAGRGLVDGAPAVYVCRQFTCEAPVTSADGVARALNVLREPC